MTTQHLGPWTSNHTQPPHPYHWLSQGSFLDPYTQVPALFLLKDPYLPWATALTLNIQPLSKYHLPEKIQRIVHLGFIIAMPISPSRILLFHPGKPFYLPLHVS